MVTPNGDLKRKYDEIGTIIEWLTIKLSDTPIYTNDEQKKCLRIMINFLKNMGCLIIQYE